MYENLSIIATISEPSLGKIESVAISPDGQKIASSSRSYQQTHIGFYFQTVP